MQGESARTDPDRAPLPQARNLRAGFAQMVNAGRECTPISLFSLQKSKNVGRRTDRMPLFCRTCQNCPWKGTHAFFSHS